MITHITLPRLMAAGLTLAALSGCGSVAAATTPTPRGGFGGRGNVIAGQLVQIDGSTLTISETRAGDVKATLASGATVQTTQTIQLADITAGQCASALQVPGPGGGTATAPAVTVFAAAADGTCAMRPGVGGTFTFGGPGGQAGNGAAGSPPAQPGGQTRPRGTRVAGKVVSVSVAAATITVTTAAGAQATITVGDGATVTQVSAGTAADLQVNDCVVATRPRGSTGTPSATTAVSVSSITVVPAGPSGCFSGGRFGGAGGQGGQSGQGGGGLFLSGGGGDGGPPPGGGGGGG